MFGRATITLGIGPHSSCLHFTKNIAHHIPEMLIFYADKIMAMGSSENSRVFNFVILPQSPEN